RWLRAYELLLRGFASDVRTPVGDVAIAPAEDVRLIASWNAASAVEVPRAALVHELVVAQVAREPERIAVEFEGRRATYGELDARANRLARKLRAIGVGRGDLVGLCVDRG